MAGRIEIPRVQPIICKEAERDQIPAQTSQMETAGAAMNMGGDEEAHSVNHEGLTIPGLSGE